MKEAFRFALPKTLPVLAGYIFLGMSFGLLMIGLDFPVWVPIVMSIFIYAGAMQFASADLLIKPTSILEAVVLTITVNARMLFYGLSMLTKYKNDKNTKWYMIFGLTDETFALNVGLDIPEELDSSHVYFFTTLLNHLYWILGTVLGVVVGKALPINYDGIEYSLTAIFIINFLEQIVTHKQYFAGFSGLFITLACLLIFGVDNFMIPSMLIIVITFAISYKVKGYKEVDNAER